ncbi:hypothetical protein [Ochrobactrum sp. Marseille-Q0166]|uniref:hypothetical protein n=1 Tax=Ochrobactrum sp. Marseille-Q0166 TaxID=2761105 RepID=UPI001655C096|nr:hypothetical protein [Ochrobactrum sp. Marseille-Q0166]MBC8718763.1 hypothetical protein [Ochrobactrum sp. Marseille-Q0166]
MFGTVAQKQNALAAWRILVRQIINMLLIQMALQRDNSYPKDDIHRGETVFETNIPGFELSWDNIVVERAPKIEKTRQLTFNVPAAKAIRLDPTNQPGIVRLSNLTITSNGDSKSLSFKDAKLNSHIVPCP